MAKSTAFFLSGAAALVYQVIWARLLARLLGSDALGISIVLAIFMSGLGLGAWAAARPIARLRDPRRTYVALQLFMALWAVCSPHWIGALDPVQALPARALVAALLLLPPTLVMGAGFPLMGRLCIQSHAETGEQTSRFYAANTMGGACGALLAPFAFMPAFGLTLGLAAGAALDLLAGALACFWKTGTETSSARDSANNTSSHPSGTKPSLAHWSRPAHALLLSSFLLGFASLALEVLLTRLLISVTGASVYAFAIVLFVFLGSLALGSSQVAARLRAGANPNQLLALCALGVAPATLIGLFALRWQLGESDLFAGLANRLPTGANSFRLWSSHALFAVFCLAPPALLFGAALPACAAALRKLDRAATELVLGRLYAFNTAGGTMGALAAGLWMLPNFGTRASLFALFALTWTAGLLVQRGTRPWWALLITVLLLPLHRTSPSSMAGASTRALIEGRDSTALVQDIDVPGKPSVRALRIHGKVVATSAPVDLRLQRFLAAIPALEAGRVDNAIVIGLGTGMTAGTLLDFPSLKKVTVLEISTAVARAAREFDPWNGALLDDPRTNLRHADGRHALLLETERYDVVTSDPIHPWTRGSSDLYALEHFESMAAHLSDVGVASQWLPLYQLSTEDVRTVIATWCAAFANTAAWLSGYDLVLVGARNPLRQDWSDVLLPPDLARHLSATGLHSAAELWGLRIATDADLRGFAGETQPMGEDRPRLEFRAPLSYSAGYSLDVLRWAARSETPPNLSPVALERAQLARKLLFNFLEDQKLGLGPAAAKYGERLSNLPPLAD